MPARTLSSLEQLLDRTKCLLFCLLVFPYATYAWDYEGHRIVNRLALASLPTNFPSFALESTAQERIAFLSGEPDRWRNTTDVPMRHFNAPDHYFDLDDLLPHEIKLETLSHFRYEFTAQLALARTAHPAHFPAPSTTNDHDRTRVLVGFLPWTITEYYAKLKSAFSYLKTFEEYGLPEEILNARQNVIYLMGVMGHFVGDAAQPLHTTRNFNGWMGDNPHGYTTNRSIHAWVDGGYLKKVGLDFPGMRSQLRPAQSLWPDDPKSKHEDVFPQALAFIQDQFGLVETLYKLDKEGKFSGEGKKGMSGRVFLTNQLVKAAQLLGDLWYSAWLQAPPDTYLKSHLARRKLAGEKPQAKP